MINFSWMASPGLAKTQRGLETLVGSLALEETQFPEMTNALKGIADGFSAHESALKLHPEAAKAFENFSRDITAFQQNLGISADAFNADVLAMFGGRAAIIDRISRDALSCLNPIQQNPVLADALEILGGRESNMGL
jgi:hypothetical protein